MLNVPFSTSDLHNCKSQKHPFSESPRHSSLKILFYTHHLTWDYCWQLLVTLLTLEEQGHIKVEVKEVVLGPDGWLLDDNNFSDREFIPFQSTSIDILTLTKVRGLWTPTTRLFWVDPKHQLRNPLIESEVPENEHTMLTTAFFPSCHADKEKLQRLEGFEHMNRSQLLLVAQKMFTNSNLLWG